MDRKKPALTSPWKVGFLVSLLLIVTAIGVSYFITGTFGVTWHWIHAAGLSPMTWSFNFGAFLEEMVPLLLLTSLLAFGAHVLVAGAVRRYKAYVDSGAEYKQLLKSIKTIEDLEDEQIVESLRQHPELREFMMSIKNRVAAVERQQTERSRRQVDNGGNARANERARERPALGPEAAILASAVITGKDGFAHDLAITTPELKQIERALRESFASAASTNRDADSTRRAIEDLRTSMRGTIAAMRRDVTACATGAREVEASLASLRQGIERLASPPAAGAGNASTVLKRLGATADALVTLGEETKRVAIATALQASGGSESDAIRTADEARGIATRFNAVAQHWRETAPVIKQMLEANADGGHSGDERRASVLTAAGAAAGKVSLWGERAVALNEHLRALEQSIGDDRLADAPEPAPAPTPDISDLDLTSVAPDAAAPETPRAQATDAPVAMRSGLEAEPVKDDTTFVDIPGFEKEHRFFAEPDVADKETSAAERFVVDESGQGRWNLETSADPASDLADEPVTASDPTSSVDSEGFITGPRPVVSPARAQRADAAAGAKPAVKAAPTAAAAEPAASNASTTATLDPNADAIDLYALGAIDYAEAA